MTDLPDARILVMSAHGFEQSELERPRDDLREKGATVDVATPDGAPVMGWDGGNWGREAAADLKIEDVDPNQYDALVIPGGQINPDLLRVHAPAVALTQAFAKQDKTVAAVCHAPWMLIEAGLVAGREVTSYRSIKTDVENAGAQWVDVPVVADRGLVTSRHPGDLDAFTGKIADLIAEGLHARRAA